jgi:hypothetical protein
LLPFGLSTIKEKVQLDRSMFGRSETSMFGPGQYNLQTDLTTFPDLLELIPERKNISFIKIEGPEFKTLSDVINFIQHQPCTVLISYHPCFKKKAEWVNFRLKHALKQLKSKKYFLDREKFIEIEPYNFGYLFKSKCHLAAANESKR